MRVEKIRLNGFRNIEARDSLFSDIIRQQPKNIFLLGDLSSAGSKKGKWLPIDYFTGRLKKLKTNIYAIPGNHEYMVNSERGIANYKIIFPDCNLYGYFVKKDSVGIVMLNSNFQKNRIDSFNEQLRWYKQIMDELDADQGIMAVITCTHHAPFTNSRIVDTSTYVIENFLPRFLNSPKTKLFISGHSHNLEYFKSSSGKYFLVAGGGGGLIQPLYPFEKRKYNDLLLQSYKPLYFYIIVWREKHSLVIQARGLQEDFQSVKEFKISGID